MNYIQITALAFLLPHVSTGWCMSTPETIQDASRKLWRGIDTNDMKLVQAAIDAGADVHSDYSSSYVEQRPMLKAISKSLDDKKIHPLLEILLNTPSLNINQIYGYGLTALDIATPLGTPQEEHFIVIQALLAHGADPEIARKGASGQVEPNIYGKIKKYPELIKFIKEGRTKYLKRHELAQAEIQKATPLPRPMAGLVSEYLYGPAERPKTGAEETKAHAAGAQTVGEDVD